MTERKAAPDRTDRLIELFKQLADRINEHWKFFSAIGPAIVVATLATNDTNRSVSRAVLTLAFLIFAVGNGYSIFRNQVLLKQIGTELGKRGETFYDKSASSPVLMALFHAFLVVAVGVAIWIATSF